MSPAGEASVPEVMGLPATEHAMGDPRASVTLLEYGDYECPACIQAAPLVAQLIEGSAGRLRFVYRHFPLMEAHPHAELAAGDRSNLRTTPAFFLNGRIVDVSFGVEKLEQAVHAALNAA